MSHRMGPGREEQLCLDEWLNTVMKKVDDRIAFLKDDPKNKHKRASEEVLITQSVIDELNQLQEKYVFVTSSPRSLSQNVVCGLAFEYEHEVLKGQYPQILTVRYRFPHGRPGSVHSGFKLSDHIVQAPPTLVATTSSLIYDVLVYSHL